MRKLFIPLLIAAIFCATPHNNAKASEHAQNQYSERGINTNLRMSLGENDIIIKLNDNAASESLVKMLHLELEFRDYNGTEKILSFSVETPQ